MTNENVHNVDPSYVFSDGEQVLLDAGIYDPSVIRMTDKFDEEGLSFRAWLVDVMRGDTRGEALKIVFRGSEADDVHSIVGETGLTVLGDVEELNVNSTLHPRKTSV